MSAPRLWAVLAEGLAGTSAECSGSRGCPRKTRWDEAIFIIARVEQRTGGPDKPLTQNAVHTQPTWSWPLREGEGQTLELADKNPELTREMLSNRNTRKGT